MGEVADRQLRGLRGVRAAARTHAQQASRSGEVRDEGARDGEARDGEARDGGARGGLLQQQPRPRGGDQCRDVQGPALSWVSQRAGEQSPFIWVERGAQRSKRALQRERATQLIQWWRALEGSSSMLESVRRGTAGGLFNAGESKQTLVEVASH